MELETNTNQILMSGWQLNDISDSHSLSHVQRDSYDGLMNSHDHDSGNGVESTHGGGPDNTTSERRTPSPSLSSSVNDEEIDSNNTEPQKVHFSNPFGDWWWEIGAASFSIACVASIMAILYTAQDKARSEWRFLILPNSLVAIFSTLSKASLMVPVASCISQLKWIHFTHAPHALSHVQVFDEASRSPWGAFILLCTFHAQKWLVAWGAVVTILALAVEPFVQAIITYPQREVHLARQANFGTAYVYSQTYAPYITPEKGAHIVSHMSKYVINRKMQGAVLNGVYDLNAPVQFQCPTGNCLWTPFTTLGACYHCQNVSAEVKVRCRTIPAQVPSNADYTACDYTTPGGVVITQTNGTELLGIPLQVNAIATQADHSGQGGTPLPYQTPTSLLALIGFVNVSIYQNLEQNRQDVMECSLNLCAKTFHNMTITNGTFSAGPITESSLEGRRASSRTEWLFELKNTSSAVPPPGKGTLVVDRIDFSVLSEYVVKLFSSSADAELGNALRSSPNITETIANISTSITYAFGTSKCANRTLGFALATEQYIHVRWAWLMLPVVVVVMGAVLLALTIIRTIRSGVTSWKSSSIPPLFAQLDGWSEDYLRAATGPMKELERKAKTMCGVVEVDGDAGKVLFVNTARGNTEIHDV